MTGLQMSWLFSVIGLALHQAAVTSPGRLAPSSQGGARHP